jgi:VIT1/CCC1 family predicted Fe2+/Mn2+ transporter
VHQNKKLLQTFLKNMAHVHHMKKEFEQGLGFGLTSSVITTLGLMIGLDAATSSKLAIAGGVVSIALADAMADALSVHTLEEREHKGKAHLWGSAYATFIAKLFFTLTFLVPLLLVPLTQAITISLAWGFLLLVILSYHAAKHTKENPARVIGIHVTLAIIVLILTKYIGNYIAFYLGA